MREPPLSNLISHYYVKPVNFEKEPFSNAGGFQKGNQFKQPNPYKKQGENQEGSKEGGTAAFNREGMKKQAHYHHQAGADSESEDEEFEVVKEKQRVAQ
jgi:hypothetical protein